MKSFTPPPNMSPGEAFSFVIRGAGALTGAASITHTPAAKPHCDAGYGDGTLHWFLDDPAPEIKNVGPSGFALTDLRGAIAAVVSAAPDFNAGDHFARALLRQHKIHGAVVFTRTETHDAWSRALEAAGAEIACHVVADPTSFRKAGRA